MDIDSKENKFSVFFYGKIFSKEIILSNFFLFIAVLIYLDLSLIKLIYISSLFIIISFVLLYLIGLKRKKNISELNTLIKAMGNHQTKAIESIKLESSLSEIENSLRSFYVKNNINISQMKKLAQARSDFLGNVSHELRTPIFAIQGFLETLLSGAIDDKNVNRRFLEKAMKHSENLNNLLNDLIDISMIESGEMRMKPIYFDLVNLINSVVDEIHPLSDKKDIKIETKFFENRIIVFGDADKLKQVLINLISNGIKYSLKGKITIKVVDLDKLVKISVSDKGCGIPEEELPRIFERFYRIDKTRAKEFGSSGLGLAIVKHIIEAHGSSIEVKSKINKGSTFSFTLRKRPL